MRSPEIGCSNLVSPRMRSTRELLSSMTRMSSQSQGQPACSIMESRSSRAAGSRSPHSRLSDGSRLSCGLEVDGCAGMTVRKSESSGGGEEPPTKKDPIADRISLDDGVVYPPKSERPDRPFALHMDLKGDAGGGNMGQALKLVVSFDSAQELDEWQRCFEANVHLPIWLSYPEIQLVMFELNGSSCRCQSSRM